MYWASLCVLSWSAWNGQDQSARSYFAFQGWTTLACAFLARVPREICDPLRNIEYLGGAQTYTRLPELARGIAIAEVISRTFPRHLPGML